MAVLGVFVLDDLAELVLKDLLLHREHRAVARHISPAVAPMPDVDPELREHQLRAALGHPHIEIPLQLRRAQRLPDDLSELFSPGRAVHRSGSLDRPAVLGDVHPVPLRVLDPALGDRAEGIVLGLGLGDLFDRLYALDLKSEMMDSPRMPVGADQRHIDESVGKIDGAVGSARLLLHAENPFVIIRRLFPIPEVDRYVANPRLFHICPPYDSRLYLARLPSVVDDTRRGTLPVHPLHESLFDDPIDQRVVEEIVFRQISLALPIQDGLYDGRLDPRLAFEILDGVLVGLVERFPRRAEILRQHFAGVLFAGPERGHPLDIGPEHRFH